MYVLSRLFQSFSLVGRMWNPSVVIPFSKSAAKVRIKFRVLAFQIQETHIFRAFFLKTLCFAHFRLQRIPFIHDLLSVNGTEKGNGSTR